MSYKSTQLVSANNTPVDPRLKSLKMVPLGASVWTSSGDLASHGITAIAHAASGSMNRNGPGFDPTRESVAASIENSFLLALAHGCKRLAIPFIGGGIFFQNIKPSITRDGLANVIVDACLAHHSSIDAVIVVYSDPEFEIFARIMKSNTDPSVVLVQGSVTHFSVHHCAAIVNAANLEVKFGGGISGIIGKATGLGDQIDQEAELAVQEFWRENSSAS